MRQNISWTRIRKKLEFDFKLSNGITSVKKELVRWRLVGLEFRKMTLFFYPPGFIQMIMGEDLGGPLGQAQPAVTAAVALNFPL